MELISYGITNGTAVTAADVRQCTAMYDTVRAPHIISQWFGLAVDRALMDRYH